MPEKAPSSPPAENSFNFQKLIFGYCLIECKLLTTIGQSPFSGSYRQFRLCSAGVEVQEIGLGVAPLVIVLVQPPTS